MATYEIPAEPDTTRVWTTDPQTGQPNQWDRGASGRWINANHGGWHPSWRSLLSIGPVTDVDPDDVSWLPPGPWLADEEVVVDDHGQQVLYVAADGLATQKSERKLAALVARLVNEHVARQAGAS